MHQRPSQAWPQSTPESGWKAGRAHSSLVRALKIYVGHTQANAIDFINYVVKKFSFGIRTIRTDRSLSVACSEFCVSAEAPAQ
jgi:hypothetical protein